MTEASVIIVSYNAQKFIGTCLSSVFKSNYKNFEVIVVENGSKERSKIKDQISKIRSKIKNNNQLIFIQNSTNLGSCEARNQGARRARGKYLIFLDCDVEIDKNLIGEYVKAFERYPKVGAMHGKSLNMEFRDKFDSAGELFDSFGFLADRAGGVKDCGQFDYVANIASGKACSYAIRRDLFNKLGGYDKDFFFFVEEPDLDMRVWLSGNRVIFLPSAVCWHAFNTRFKNSLNYYSRYLVRYYGPRNYILMLLKNFSWGRLLKMLPLTVGSLLGLVFLFIITGRFRDGYYILKGIGWNLTNWSNLMKKRAKVQKMRAVKDRDLDFLFEKRPIGHYIKKARSYFGNTLK